MKCHSIPALTKYIRSCSLLSVPDIDGWRMKNLFQRIFLSPDNEDLKVLVYDCFYILWLKGDFLPEFAPEYTVSVCLIWSSYKNRVEESTTLLRLTSWDGSQDMLLFKPHNKQPSKRVSTLIQTSKSWFCQKQKDGTSHCLYFLNPSYSDLAFTSVEDVEDPMVITY